MLNLNSGFFAALDQSGGGSRKALELYGLRDFNDDNLFDLMHDMRARIIKSPSFSSDKISGVILFEEEIYRNVDDINMVKFITDKGINCFVKIDQGLEKVNNGVQLMRSINNLDILLSNLKRLNVCGTKMRSFILENNKKGIREIVKQQFLIAKKVWDYGLIPILETEIDINASDKYECEVTLRNEIDKFLSKLGDMKIIFKFTLPSIPNFYRDYLDNDNVLSVLALSGGYSLKEACSILSKNDLMQASFCRALLEGLKYDYSDSKFDKVLGENIDMIYNASIYKTIN